MNTYKTFTTLTLSTAVLGAALLHGQGRGGAEWTTNGFDAQRSGSMAADPRISVATMLKPGDFGAFKFLWKMKLEHEPGAPTALTQAVYLDRVIGFRGFKSIAFVGTASGTIHAIDVDFGTPLWKYHINYTASPPPVRAFDGCPGGLTSGVSRPTAIATAVPAGGAGGGRGGRSGGGVGEPGRGALTLATAGQPRGGGAPPAGPGGAADAGRGVVAPGTAVPGTAAAAAGAQPGALPGAARAGGGGGGGGRGFSPGADAAYVVGVDGYLHALNVQNGWDSMTPAMFLPANTRATGLIVATTGDSAVTYATTINGCGSQPDGVWAMDLASPQKTVTGYQPKDANIAGGSGAAIGRDGTLYIATKGGAGSLSNQIIALEPKTLRLKSQVGVAQAGFSSSPVIFQSRGKEFLAVAGAGKIYLFDTTALLAGPIASAALGTATSGASAVITWQDAQSVRYLAAPTSRGIVAMKVTDADGKLTLTPGWTSSEIVSPLAPIVVNGVMFAASTGTRAVPGTLHALEAATGKALFSSARSITGPLEGSLSAGGGNVYVPGADGTLYAFGFAIEK